MKSQPSKTTKPKKTSVSRNKIELVGPISKLSDDKTTYYEGIRVMRNYHNDYNIAIGNVCFVESGDAKPYIAMIDELYRDESGSRLCKATWFYRRGDVTKLHPNILDKFTDIHDNDLFFSKDADVNLADLILSPCDVKFIYADNRSPRRCLSTDYVCSYRFNSVGGTITKLKPAHIERYTEKLKPLIFDESGNVMKQVSKASKSTLDENSPTVKDLKRKIGKRDSPVFHDLVSKVKLKRGPGLPEAPSTDQLSQLGQVPKGRPRGRSKRDYNTSVSDSASIGTVDSAFVHTLLTDTVNHDDINVPLATKMETQSTRWEVPYGKGVAAKSEFINSTDSEILPSEPDSIADDVAEECIIPDDAGFARLCVLARPQIIAKYSASGKNLSQSEVLAILIEMWSEMDEEERKEYLNDASADEVLIRDDIAEAARAGLKFDSSSENFESGVDSDAEDVERNEMRAKHKAAAFDPVVTRSRHSRGDGVLRNPVETGNEAFLATTPETSIHHPSRVGNNFQAFIPETIEAAFGSSSLEFTCGAISSKPSNFNMDGYTEYVLEVKRIAYDRVLAKMAEEEGCSSYTFDGSFVLFSVSIESIALESLNENDLDTSKALSEIIHKVDKCFCIWNAEDQRVIAHVFKKHEDNVRKLKAALPHKSLSHILEYVYKLLYTTLALEEDLATATKSSRRTKYSFPDSDAENEVAESGRAQAATSVSADPGGLFKKARVVTRGVAKSAPALPQVSHNAAFAFLKQVKKSLDGFSFTMIVNSFILLKREIISPVQLVIRTRSIIELSHASKDERATLHTHFLGFLPQQSRKLFNVPSLTLKKKVY